MPSIPAYQTRNRYFAAKIQDDAVTPATPDTTSNAIEVEAPVVGPDLQSVNTNEAGGGLDQRPPIFSGGRGNASCTAYFKHSGTAETPPDYGTLLRGCAMEETITSSAVAGTAQAGATTSITLASGASAVDDYYQGMPITVTGGTGSGYQGFVVAYNGTTKVATVSPTAGAAFDATTAYSIPKNVRYRPRSSSLEWLTIRRWDIRSDAGLSRLNEVDGAQGTWTYTGAPHDLGRFAFTFAGDAVAPTDVSEPSAPVVDATRPSPWIGASATCLNGITVAPAALQVTYGATAVAADDPNEDFGYGPGIVTSRAIAGQLELPMDLLSNRNFFDSMVFGTEYHFVTGWGASAGKRVGIVIPRMIFSRNVDADRSGNANDNLSWGANGPNKGVYLVHY